MNHLRAYLVFLLLLQVLSTSAQVNPPWGDVYEQGVVPRVEVTMDPSDLEWLLADENLDNEEYLVASLSFTSADGNAFTSDSVGIRLRGNTSRYAPKKSFKIHLERFGGPELHGIEKLNLKGAHNDPSIMRERIAYQIMREMNGPAPRVNNVELYINGEYKGLYVNFEQIDNDFMGIRFGSEIGNIYKCHWGAALALNDDVWNDEVFELENNKSANDRSDLVQLINVLNNSSDQSFRTEVEEVLNVDQALKYLAVEVLIGHWDGYSYNKNNYYLYHNPETDKFEIIMYDPDNTFGIDWFGIDWTSQDLYDWGHPTEDRPLFWRLLDVPEYRDRYTGYLREMLDGPFHPTYIFPIVDSIHQWNHPHAMKDNYYTMTYGFDAQAYNESTSAPWGAHVKYGIKPYIEARRAFAEDQIDEIIVEQPEEPRIADTTWKHTERARFTEFWNEGDSLEQVVITIVDIRGRPVADQERTVLQPGERIRFYLGSGFYFALCSTSTGRATVKFIIP